MRLGFVLYPDADLTSSVERWRDLGMQVLWWPDDVTVVLGQPGGTLAQVMLEDHPAEHRLGSGPVFIVEKVDEVSNLPGRLELAA